MTTTKGKRISTNIRLLRVLSGLDQAEAAGRVGRTQAWLSQIECGKRRPQSREATKLGRILGREAVLREFEDDQ